MNVCMAATYDPDPQAPLGFRAAVPPRDRRAARARAGSAGSSTTRCCSCARHARNLRRLKGIYVDCGWRDQYHIHYGARQLSRALAAARHRPPLRGIRRRPLGHRLPDGREPAVPLSGAAAVTRAAPRTRPRQRLGARLGAHRRHPRARGSRPGTERRHRRLGRCARRRSVRLRHARIRWRTGSAG